MSHLVIRALYFSLLCYCLLLLQRGCHILLGCCSCCCSCSLICFAVLAAVVAVGVTCSLVVLLGCSLLLLWLCGCHPVTCCSCHSFCGSCCCWLWQCGRRPVTCCSPWFVAVAAWVSLVMLFSVVAVLLELRIAVAVWVSYVNCCRRLPGRNWRHACL